MKCQIRNGQIVEVPTEPKVVIDFEESLGFYRDFYQARGVKIPRDFTKVFRGLWLENQKQILRAVEVKGFDFLLLGLPVISVEALDEQITGGGDKTYFWIDPKDIKEHPLVRKPRLVLMHQEPDLRNLPILKETLGQPAQTFLDQKVTTTFSDYRVYNEVVWEKIKVRPDSWGAVWCPGSRAGSSVVRAFWHPVDAQVRVLAFSPDYSFGSFGCRPSRCFCKRN